MFKMKKNRLPSLYIVLLSIMTIIHILIPKIDVMAEQEITIPDEAIRLRILANSDKDKDQQIKHEIRDAINAEITEWVQHLTSLDEAREIIKNRLPDIENIAEQIIAEHNIDQAVKVEFKNNVSFPTKLYGEFLYPAGNYEAILITLGKGAGTNWWCVLFPPLCFLDFSNGVAVSDGFEDEEKEQSSDYFVEEKEEPIKIKFFIVELFKKIF